MSEQEQVSQPLRVPVPRQRTLTRADVASQFEAVTGRRAVLSNRSGTFRDYRVWSEPQERPVGFQPDVRRHLYLPVVSERAWWAHRLLGRPPSVLWWPAGAVWVEDDDTAGTGPV